MIGRTYYDIILRSRVETEAGYKMLNYRNFKPEKPSNPADPKKCKRVGHY